MKHPLTWPKIIWHGTDLRFSEYGHGEDGYLVIWQGRFMVAVLLAGEQDARPPDRGNTVTSHARLRTVLRWLATFTLPPGAVPILVTVPAEDMRAFSQLAEGCVWCQCVIETAVPGYDEPMTLSIFQAVSPEGSEQRCAHQAAVMMREAQRIAQLALWLAATQQ